MHLQISLFINKNYTMPAISKQKCNSFKEYLSRYQQKSHLHFNDLNNLLMIIPQIYNDPIDNDLPTSLPQTLPTSTTPSQPKQTILINTPLNTVADVLSLLDANKIDANTEYSVNLHMLNNIRPELEALNSMVGMKTLKTAILDQLLFYIQGFDGTQDFKHTVLYGPPGTGKTEIAKIMGKMYSKLGVIKKPSPDKVTDVKPSPASEAIATLFSCKPLTNIGTTAFKKITRADMIAGYVGQTALKTKALINECLGGVIFLDEAYSLGGKDDGDTFSKECVDTLCESLSNYKENLMFIIAGYEKDLKSHFFSMNQGLDSRFVWRFKIDDYTSNDLWDIFVLMVNKDKQWKIDDELNNKGQDWFKRNFKKFPCFGRDVETFLFKTKIAHSRRVYCLPTEKKGVLTLDDMDAGLDKFFSKDAAAELENRRLISSLYA